METKTKKVEETQGVAETKKQKPSATYTLTQFTEMVEKLKVLELINQFEAEQLTTIRQAAKERFIERL